MNQNRPIGVFDSGVGGLTVVSALTRRLPNEEILYLGDTARLPYGTKSKETVTRYTKRNVDFLVGRGVKAVVVACNTATALALDDLAVELPLWGVVGPGARAAAALADRGPIGVLATESTVDSGAYQRAIQALNPAVTVHAQACPLFVPLVEEGWADDPVAELVARRYLEPLLEKGVRTLVLGCTHYPLLSRVIEKVAGPRVLLVDSAETVAREVEAELSRAGLLRLDPAPPRHHFCVTDRSPRFARIARGLLHPVFLETRHQEPVPLPFEEDLTLEWVEV
jgi:glutamate racemase